MSIYICVQCICGSTPFALSRQCRPANALETVTAILLVKEKKIEEMEHITINKKTISIKSLL